MEKDQQLKKMIPQLLLSLSVFSFLYSYSSSLLYSSKFQRHFSADSLHFLSHALLDKNCLFLICNGLLVFLSKSSGFIRAPSDPDPDDALQKRISDSLHTALQKYVLEEAASVHEEKRENSTESTGEEVSIFIAESEGELAGDDEEKDENDHQLDSNRFWLFEDDDDDDRDEEYELYGDKDHDAEKEEEEEEEEEVMSTEELNQKIEDFIRKMKEEIIISEDRQKQMVVVK